MELIRSKLSMYKMILGNLDLSEFLKWAGEVLDALPLLGKLIIIFPFAAFIGNELAVFIIGHMRIDH